MAFLIFGLLIFYDKVFAHNYNIHVHFDNTANQEPHRPVEPDLKLLVPSIGEVAGIKDFVRGDDIDLDYYDDHLYNIVDQGSSKKKRNKRLTTYAGYSSNPDICKIYNHNLVKLWGTIKKYIVTETHEMPNKMSLHNIALIIKAYLDHSESHDKADNVSITTEKVNVTHSDVTLALAYIRKITEDTLSADTVEKIVGVIENNVTLHNKKKDKECAVGSKETLRNNVYEAFQKLLENSDCRRQNTETKFEFAKNVKGRSELPVTNLNERMDEDKAKLFLRYLRSHKAQTCFEYAQTLFLEEMTWIIQRHIRAEQCLTDDIFEDIS